MTCLIVINCTCSIRSVALPYTRSKYGQRLQPMEYGGFDCRGNEASLSSCRVDESFLETWSDYSSSNHRHYAGVKCIPRNSGKKLKLYTCMIGEINLTYDYNKYPCMQSVSNWLMHADLFQGPIFDQYASGHCL